MKKKEQEKAMDHFWVLERDLGGGEPGYGWTVRYSGEHQGVELACSTPEVAAKLQDFLNENDVIFSWV